MTLQTLRILAADEQPHEESPRVLSLGNDVDVLDPVLSLEGLDRIELAFPKFSDGRVFSQAFLLRRRRGFAGDIRATGDVLIDQLVQMQRTGFSSAVLRAGLDASAAQRQFARFADFYQGDAVETLPRFARGATLAAAGLLASAPHAQARTPAQAGTPA